MVEYLKKASRHAISARFLSCKQTLLAYYFYILSVSFGNQKRHVVCYSTADYYTPVWFCTGHTHFIGSVLNDALCIVTKCLRPTSLNACVTKCLRPTSMDHLPILSDIQPAELLRLGATLLGLPRIAGH